MGHIPETGDMGNPLEWWLGQQRESLVRARLMFTASLHDMGRNEPPAAQMQQALRALRGARSAGADDDELHLLPEPEGVPGDVRALYVAMAAAVESLL